MSSTSPSIHVALTLRAMGNLDDALLYGRAAVEGFARYGAGAADMVALAEGLVGLIEQAIAEGGAHPRVDVPRYERGGEVQIGHRVTGKAVLSCSTPAVQCGSQFPQTLQREEVGGQRHDHIVGCNQCGTVDRPQVRAEVNQNNVRGMHCCGLLHRAPEGRPDAKGPLISAKTFGPDFRLGTAVWRRRASTGRSTPRS